MPDPSGSQEAPRSGPALNVSRTGGVLSNGCSLPWGGAVAGSVWPQAWRHSAPIAPTEAVRITRATSRAASLGAVIRNLG